MISSRQMSWTTGSRQCCRDAKHAAAARVSGTAQESGVRGATNMTTISCGISCQRFNAAAAAVAAAFAPAVAPAAASAVHVLLLLLPSSAPMDQHSNAR